MKKLFVLLGLSLVLTSFAYGQDADDIIKSLRSADADQVAVYFDESIDLKLPDNANELKNINKKQAGLKLRDFFSEYNVTGFDLNSKREMGGMMAVTGKFSAANKSGYNVTLMLKEKNGRYSIITLRVN